LTWRRLDGARRGRFGISSVELGYSEFGPDLDAVEHATLSGEVGDWP